MACNHCGMSTDLIYSFADVVWCAQCTMEESNLLMSLGLDDGSYYDGSFRRNERWWGHPPNVNKLQAVPKKGQVQ